MSELVTEPPQSEPPASPATLLPRDVWSWIATISSAVLTYMIVSRGLLSTGPEWEVGAFVGAITALVASSIAQGTVVGVLAPAIGLAALPPALQGHAMLSAGSWVVSVAAAIVFSLGVGYLRVWWPERRQLLELAIATLLVVWIVASMWAPLLASGFTSYASLKAATIADVPHPGDYVNDDAIYRSIFYRMHNGIPYYNAFKEAWYGLKQAPPLPTTVVAYRLPTMYWLWKLLPTDAFLIEVVFLAFASVGCVAAAFITGQMIGTRFAPLSAAALAAFAMGSAITVYVTYIDLPAASVALVAIALFLRATITGRTWLLWAAAAVMTAAALTREILVYFVVLAALASLFAPSGSRLKRVIPWLASLGIFAVGYAAHAVAIHNVMHATTTTLSYVKGSPAFALDSIRRFSDVMQAGGIVLPTLFALGVLGAVAAWKRVGRVFAIFAVVALLAPILGMMKLGNPGIDVLGHEVNYWGNLFDPLALALWPAWLLFLPLGRQDLSTSADRGVTESADDLTSEADVLQDTSTDTSKLALSATHAR